MPRRGYRFVPAIEAAEPLRPDGWPFTAWAQRARRWAAAAAAAVVLACGLVAGAAQSGAHARVLPAETRRQYELGQYWWNQRTLAGTRRSIALFRGVVKAAPWSPLGYVGLAEAYAMIANHHLLPGKATESYARAASYAREALARDPKCGEAFALLGFIALDRDRNVAVAERALRTAVMLQPGYASGHEFLGTLALERGDLNTADAQLRRAIDLEPTSPMVLTWYGMVQYYEGRYDAARSALRDAFDLQRDNEMAAYFLVLADAGAHEYGEARALLAAFKHSPHQAALAGLTAYVDLHAGRRAVALREMPDLRPRRIVSRRDHLDPATLAALCLDLGRRGDALAWVRNALADPEYHHMIGEVLRDPRLHTIANDPAIRAPAV